jgi:REP-associated tyrosine transposase
MTINPLIDTQLQLGERLRRSPGNRFNGFLLVPYDKVNQSTPMPRHSYCRVWLHLVWGTLERRPLLSKPIAAKVSAYLSQYASEKGIYVKISYVNRDHVHVLVDLPAKLALEEMMQLLKGSSSHWINQSNLLPCKFAWGRGYGAFSVSHSGVNEVAKYIATQEEHHHKRSFSEELQSLVERYGLTWHDDETAEAVGIVPCPAPPR